MNEKTKKGLNIAANILVAIIFCTVLLFAVMAITNAKNGYNNVFGLSYMAVKTDSMQGDKKDSFDENDMITIKLLNDQQKKELEKDDVITFWTLIDGKRVLNTHRIVGVETIGEHVYYTTKGDHNTGNDPLRVVSGDVIGKYLSKMKKVGGFFNFLQSQTGFMIFVVVPAILALGYSVFLFITNLKGFNKEKSVEKTAALKAEIESQIREEMKEQAASGLVKKGSEESVVEEESHVEEAALEEANTDKE